MANVDSKYRESGFFGGAFDFLSRSYQVIRSALARVELIAASPELARKPAVIGASREASSEYFFPEIRHYLYGGDTALHIAWCCLKVGLRSGRRTVPERLWIRQPVPVGFGNCCTSGTEPRVFLAENLQACLVMFCHIIASKK